MLTHLWSAGASTHSADDAGASLMPPCGLQEEHEEDPMVGLRLQGGRRLWPQHETSPLPERSKWFTTEACWDPELIRKMEQACKIFLHVWGRVCDPKPDPAEDMLGAATHCHTLHFLPPEPAEPDSGQTRMPQEGGGSKQPAWNQEHHCSPKGTHTCMRTHTHTHTNCKLNNVFELH